MSLLYIRCCRCSPVLRLRRCRLGRLDFLHKGLVLLGRMIGRPLGLFRFCSLLVSRMSRPCRRCRRRSLLVRQVGRCRWRIHRLLCRRRCRRMDFGLGGSRSFLLLGCMNRRCSLRRRRIVFVLRVGKRRSGIRRLLCRRRRLYMACRLGLGLLCIGRLLGRRCWFCMGVLAGIERLRRGLVRLIRMCRRRR